MSIPLRGGALGAVKILEKIIFNQCWVKKGFAAADVEVGYAMQHEVHADDACHDVDELLAVEPDGPGVAVVAIHLSKARD